MKDSFGLLFRATENRIICFKSFDELQKMFHHLLQKPLATITATGKLSPAHLTLAFNFFPYWMRAIPAGGGGVLE